MLHKNSEMLERKSSVDMDEKGSLEGGLGNELNELQDFDNSRSNSFRGGRGSLVKFTG